MKKLIKILFFVPIIGYGQSQNQNYIKTINYKQPTQTSISSPAPNQAFVNVTYSDGYGRPIQEILSHQSNSGKDILFHVDYDAFGRQKKQYLPYSNQSPTLDYNSNAESELLTYYNSAAYQGTINPFSESSFESHPSSRIMEMAFPGNDWSISNNHTLKYIYDSNSNSDAVKKFKAIATWNSLLNIYDISLVEDIQYSEKTLIKTIVKNENWTSGKNNTTEEFKDKEGRIVLKREYSNYDNQTEVAHNTYYVYDQFGNLTYVIPPIVDTTNTILPNIIDGNCYQYKFDKRNRLVEKKLPGKGWEFIVYDKLDRVVATGPNQAPFSSDSNIGWLITKYDIFDRVVYTGWYSGHFPDSSNRNIFQGIQNNASILNESKSSTNTINNISVAYTNNVLPTSGFYLLTANYYDNYNYPGAPTLPTTVQNQNVLQNVKGLLTGGWVRVLTDENEFDGNLYSFFYDAKGRIIQNYLSNYEGGYLQVDSELDFSGKTLKIVKEHKKNPNENIITIKDTYSYNSQELLLLHKQQINQLPEQLIVKNIYNELGILQSKNVGGTDITGSIGLQQIDYTYNVRGWLTSINNNQPQQNNGLIMNNDDLFSFKINYNRVEYDSIPNVSPLYNGNISEIYWESSSDYNLRKYSYDYDNLNRLRKATYQKPLSSVWQLNSYNEELTYDKNGNIKTLLRNGNMDTETLSNGVLNIDNLTYTYHSDKSNQLMKVFDSSNMADGFKDDSDGITDPVDDYNYDENGNMISDDNKGILNIVYNHLNLPIFISFNTGETIEYIYDAIGNKLQKKVTTLLLNVPPTITDYSNGFQYKSGILQFFPHEEGYVNVTSSSGTNNYNYVFNYTDHLGNVRLSYGTDPSTGALKIIEENHYYPFGLKHMNYNSDRLIFQLREDIGGLFLGRPPIIIPPSYKYKYNGKEWQDEFGLNVYDYGARNYDPTIGRWMNYDPLAEKFSSYSPYNYAYNNPVYYIDNDGLEPTPYEAALMASHVYGTNVQLVGGWAVSSYKMFNQDKNNGLKATMYERTKGNGQKEYAFVYAGTDDWQDVKHDLIQPFGFSEQYNKVKKLAKFASKNLRKKELTFVGHSLGGGLSNLSALVTGRTSITFNPAWLSSRTLDEITIAPLFDWGNHITNYVHQSDPLDRFQETNGWKFGLDTTGDTVELDGDIWDGLWNGHFIDEMIDALEDNDMNERHEKDGSDNISKPAEAERGFFDKFAPWEWDE